MKKYSFILFAFLVGGCAMGINQSVATINGKTYLVEKNTYSAPFYLPYEWSSDPRFTEIDGNKVLQAELKKLREECVSSMSEELSEEKIYKCISNKIK